MPEADSGIPMCSEQATQSTPARFLPPGRIEPRVHMKDRSNYPHLHCDHTSDQLLPGQEIATAALLTDVLLSSYDCRIEHLNH
jgi:hypothetical protein